MAEAMVRLENVDLVRTSLTPDQVQSIFTKISNCENLKLTELDISQNILSSVPADVLVKAISRLERVWNTSLTRDQVTAILTFVAETPSSTQSLMKFLKKSVRGPLILFDY